MEFPDPDSGYVDDGYGAPPGAGMGGGAASGDPYGAPPPGAGMGGARYSNAPPPGAGSWNDEDDGGDYDEEVRQFEDRDAAPEQVPLPAAAASNGDGSYPAAGAAAAAAVAAAGGGSSGGEFPEDYIEAFQIYDKDYGDDAISAGMLGTVLRALGQNPTEGQLAELVQTMGKEVYTVADVDFILRNYDLRDQCSAEDIKDMWEMVAGPGQTFVQKAALQGVLSKIGDKIFEQDFSKIMMAANVGGDVVTFDQFERIMTN